MKVTDLCRKLRTAAVAGGLLVPGAAYAAELDTNLVVNGDFEVVDLDTVSFYNAPLILNWGSNFGFCYSHDLSGESVPDFANGGPLASGGHWYFSPGNSLIHSRPEAITQDIDVSTGDTASAIGNGSATYDLSAFFSTYDGQADRGFVRVDFLGSGGANLGFAQVNTPAGPAIGTWTQFSSSGTVPSGSLTLHVSAWGEVFEGSEGSADGYTDNIDFRILEVVGLLGDFNADDKVDAADYVRWRANQTANSPLPNDNGLTTQADRYNLWRENFGEMLMNGSGSGTTAVPEASSLVLVSMGLASVAVVGRGGTRNRSS